MVQPRLKWVNPTEIVDFFGFNDPKKHAIMSTHHVFHQERFCILCSTTTGCPSEMNTYSCGGVVNLA